MINPPGLNELTPQDKAIWDGETEQLQVGVTSGLRRYKYKLTDLTCCGCPVLKECPWRWDLYNTNGDCLALK